MESEDCLIIEDDFDYTKLAKKCDICEDDFNDDHDVESLICTSCSFDIERGIIKEEECDLCGSKFITDGLSELCNSCMSNIDYSMYPNGRDEEDDL